MEAIFLKIINMSITASYVILAVLFIRLLLKKSPKKYAYLLWAVVLYRLVCPLSFSSMISIFHIKPFDLTVAQREGASTLKFIPDNIGYMKTPKISVGLPTMNSIINENLPAATPYTSINPMQVLITLGTILWCIVFTILLVYSITTYMDVKRRLSTAVRLNGNVFESDKIGSPFIFGILRPRIYIPFGLSEQEQAYILLHERYHLKRKDHLIKPLSFFVLILHWFNPLVWLAYLQMEKDMEMSCDEKVLSQADGNIVKNYSTLLLSFAINKRFPKPSPLTFGEISIRDRVKNLLRFQKPKKWTIILTSILCLMTALSCIMNPKINPKAPVIKEPAGPTVVNNDSTTLAMEVNELFGNYVFEKQLYMNPLSSFLAFDGFIEYYTLTKNFLIITDSDGSQQRISVDYEKSEFDEEEFKNSFFLDISDPPDISTYKERFQYTLNSSSDVPFYRIYCLDNEIWFAKINRDTANLKMKEYIWSIYKIKPYNEEPPMKVAISGNHFGVETFLTLQHDYHTNDPSDYASDTCYNITPDIIKESSEYTIFKYNTSSASFLLYEDTIYPLGIWFGGYGVTSLALADMDEDETPELYFTYSWGSGLHRSHAAYFDPNKKEVVTFDYTLMDRDMMIIDKGDGSLSVYEAAIRMENDFSNFETQKGNFLADIVTQDGQISLAPVVSK